MSSVMSRVSNGVGLWVSLAIDRSWRRTQGHHEGSRHQAVEACASDRHSGTARRWRGSGSEVWLREMESERVVCVRATGPQECTCDFRLSSCSASHLWSGRFRLISRARGEEAMVGHVTPVNWPVPMNRGPHWSPKRKGSWSSSSPRHHLDQTQLTRIPEPCNSGGHRQEGTPVCRHLRARMEVLRPRVVPVHTRRSQRDVEQKRTPQPPGRRKSGRTEQLRQPGVCCEGKGCSCSSGSQHDTVWARSHEGVVSKAVWVGVAASEQ